MKIETCNICGNYKYGYERFHSCPPSWWVWQEHEEPDENWRKIYADNENKAIDIYLSPILNDEFDSEERIVFVLNLLM